MFTLFGKKAKIHRNSWDDKTEKSPDFANVPTANHALSAHLASNGSVIINKDVNDDDGSEVTALEKIGGGRLWGETRYSVKPNTGGKTPL